MSRPFSLRERYSDLSRYYAFDSRSGEKVPKILSTRSALEVRKISEDIQVGCYTLCSRHKAFPEPNCCCASDTTPSVPIISKCFSIRSQRRSRYRNREQVCQVLLFVFKMPRCVDISVLMTIPNHILTNTQ